MLPLHDRSKTVSTGEAFRVETIDRVIPRYVDRPPPDEIPRFRAEVARKLLRNARTALSRRKFGTFANNVARSFTWSPTTLASGAVRFLLRTATRET